MTLAKPWEKLLSLVLCAALVVGFCPLTPAAQAQETPAPIEANQDADVAVDDTTDAPTAAHDAASDDTASEPAPAAEPSEPAASLSDEGEGDIDPVPTTIAVKYVLNGGKNAAANAASFTSDSTLKLANPSRSGYLFLGWYLDSKFKTKVTTLSVDNAKDNAITVYAKWGKGNLAYKAKNSAWSATVALGKAAGSSYVQGIRIYNKSTNLSGSVTYRVKTSNGWSAYKKNGATASYNGKIRCIQVKLTGDLAAKYDVYYRVKVGDGGWLGWAKNGATAGISWRGITAYQIKLVKKGGSAPGSTAKAYINKSTGLDFYMKRVFAKKVENKSSKSKYIIVFSSTYNRLAIFKGKKGNWTLYKYWLCATGAPGTPSPKGTYTVDYRGYSFGSGFTCWWWTEWNGPYLFHSETYLPGSKKRSDIIENALGHNMTHGCVRLDIKNAKWIYDHIPNGTKVISM